MRVVVAGSRGIGDVGLVGRAIVGSGFEVTEVISGGAVGVDRCGEIWAVRNKIPVRVMEADWGRDGKAAGYLRNERMAREGDALVAVWDGKSRGTKNMIEWMEKLGKPVFVFRVE